MPKDKSTGKKLADMLYGNPERAAFGVFPQLGRRGQAKPAPKQADKPFIDERAMELPQFGDLDLDVPTSANRAMGQRMVERDVDLKRQADRDMSPLEKLAGGIQAGRLIGSALTQSAKSIPTAITKGSKAAEDYIAENIYQPTQPKAYEYAGNIADFLTSLESDYKIPPIIPEAMVFQNLVGPATRQAGKAVKQGAKQGALNLAAPRTLNPQAGVFIGPKAKTFHQGRADMAVAMEEAGRTPQEIWLATGTFRGADGILRQEIDDRAAKFLSANERKERIEAAKGKIAEMKEKIKPTPQKDLFPKALTEAKKEVRDDISILKSDVEQRQNNPRTQGLLAQHIFEHPELYAAYPELQNVKIVTEGGSGGGARGSLSIMPSRGFYPGSMEMDIYDKGLRSNPTSTALHEMQHAVQTLEGMGPGGNPTFAFSNPEAHEILKKLREETYKPSTFEQFQRVNKFPEDEAQAAYEQYLKERKANPITSDKVERAMQETAAMEYYKRLLGEAEARAVQDRQMMTPAQRMETPPPASYDVPQEDLIVKPPREYADGGRVHISDNPDVMALELQAGGLVKGLKAAAKAAKGTQDVLPVAEREANKAKFLEPSAVKERMYHGTTANINQFKPQTGDAVFLTPDPRFASKFAWNDMLFTASPQDGGFINPGANVMPVHVQAKNPFDYENPKHIRSVLSNLDPRDKKAFKKSASEGSWQEIEKHIGTIQDTGFDSVFLKEMGRKNLAVFEPNQIKSDIGNRGTYDINDPDLNKAEGGAVHMQAGGLAKAAKAAAKALKPAEAPMKASEALGRIEGRPLVITQADRTKVGGGFLGGPGFSGLQLEDPAYRAAEAAWGVKTPGVAKMILGGGKTAGKDPVYAAMLGTPTQHQSNQMVFDKLYGDFKKSAKKGSLDSDLRDRINMRLANTVDKEGNPIFPPDVDILGKNFKDLANTFDRRAVTANLIGGMGVGGKKGQIIDYDKIIRETTDPLLIDSPTGALGNRLFTLSGGIIERPDLHPAFPTILQGEDLGVSFDPVARELIMKDFMERTMREKGRTPGYMDYTRGYPPSQLITEDLLTGLQKMGKKAGGEVKAPAAQIDGNKFVLAAQKYGLGDDMTTLNKMVSLVNRGATVDEAARVVAGGVRKAAGGEITADDLILEERKL